MDLNLYWPRNCFRLRRLFFALLSGCSGLLGSGLDLVEGLLSVLGPDFLGLGLFGGDLLKGHTNDLSVDSLGSLSSLLVVAFGRNLLVESSPGGGPSDLIGLYLSLEHLYGLLANEGMESRVLGDDLDTLSWIDLKLGEIADFCFDNH